MTCAAENITRHFRGEWHGNYGAIPTPGHSAKDRGTTVRMGESGDVIFHAHNDPALDWRALKDECRTLGLIPERERAAVDFKAGAWRETGVYVYRDAAGTPVYRTVRKEKPGEEKRFVAQRPDGKGGWVNGLGEIERVPYRLPELIHTPRGEIVYFVEGERKADKLDSWGFAATAIAFGAKGWRNEYAAHFAGRTVVILPDNDDPGRQFAAKVCAALSPIAGKVATLLLPGPPKGDIIDWAGNGGSAFELSRLATEALAKQPEGAAAPKVPAYQLGISAAALMKKQFEPVRYIVEGLLAEGVTLFGGAPKIGKSWLAYDLALAIPLGRPVFGRMPVDQGDVLYLALEDNERRLRGRLLKKGVTAPERLTLATEWPGLDGGCLEELDAWAEAVAKPVLVIVDVLKMVRGVTRGTESLYDADYRALTGLATWGRRRGIAVLVVHHVRKMASEDPLESLSGTNGLTGAADTVMVLKRDIGTGNCLLYVRGRDIEEAELAVRFKPDNGTWELLGAAEDVGRTSERDSILAVLRSEAKPLTAREVSDILGKNYDAVRKCLTRMAHAGEATKEGRGLYTCPNCPSVPTEPQPDIGTHGTGGNGRSTKPRDFSEWNENAALGLKRPMILAPGETGDEPVPGFEE